MHMQVDSLTHRTHRTHRTHWLIDSSWLIATRTAPLRSRAYRMWIDRTGSADLFDERPSLLQDKAADTVATGDRCAFLKCGDLLVRHGAKTPPVRLKCWKVATAHLSCLLILTHAQGADVLEPHKSVFAEPCATTPHTMWMSWHARGIQAGARANPKRCKNTEETKRKDTSKYYDNGSPGSDIRKNRKIVIFLSLKVCLPVHVYDFKS